MAELLAFLSKFEWAIHGLLFVGLVALVARSIGMDYVEALYRLIGEVRDLLARKKSVGAINMLSWLVLAVVGLVLVAATEFHTVIVLLAERIGTDKAAYAVKSANLYALFYVLAFVMCFSLVCVVIDGRGRK